MQCNKARGFAHLKLYKLCERIGLPIGERTLSTKRIVESVVQARGMKTSNMAAVIEMSLEGIANSDGMSFRAKMIFEVYLADNNL